MDETPIEALRAFGASEETLAQARRELAAWTQQQALEVMPENWYAVRLFDASATQWRVAATSGRMCWIGLDYTAVRCAVHDALRHSGVPHARTWAEVLPQLQVMETAALQALNAA